MGSWPLLSFVAALVVAHAADAQAPVFRHVLDGGSAGDEFGVAVAGAGDVDADGASDFIIGAWRDAPNGADSGRATVYSGATGATLWTFDGAAPGDLFGAAVDSAGDVDGDGHDDVIVGAYLDDANGQDSGAATVFSGRTGLVVWTGFGDRAGDEFGCAVAGVGDVNGDGYDDICVGARLDDSRFTNGGSARVYCVRTGTVIHRFDGRLPFELFGNALSSAGDVDGDGFDDLVVGALFANPNGQFSGTATLYSGQSGLLLRIYPGRAAGDLFGNAVDGVGDLDGDGFDDVIIGARGDDRVGTDAGAATVYSSRTGLPLFDKLGAAAGDQFGVSVAGLGDVDGDGIGDFAIGAHRADVGPRDAGRVIVYSGRSGDEMFRIEGTGARDELGFSIAAAGDADLDGHRDLVVGSHLANPPTGIDAGRAILVTNDYPTDALVVRRVGAGCAGSIAWLPRLGVDGRGRTGDALDFTLRSALPGATATLVLGPLWNRPLRTLGAPGCTAIAMPFDARQTVADANGAGRVEVRVPDDPRLAGVEFFAQWWITDPTNNPLGGAFSAGAAVRVAR